MGVALKLEGQRFGRLVVVERAGTDKNKQALWLCKCDCGNETKVDSTKLKRGNTKSCGCYMLDRAREANTTHGLKGVFKREYAAWKGLRTRCLSKNNPAFGDYGGRGITIDPSWDSFPRFLSDMGLKPGPGYSIDRIDNDGPYAAWNCRWATREEQNNNKRSNKVLSVFGARLTLEQASRKYGVHRATISSRLKAGMSPEEAVSR